MALSQRLQHQELTEPQLPCFKTAKEPSLREILEFGRQINLPLWVLERLQHQIDYPFWWWELLHDLAHFSVKPNSYIEYWRRHNSPGGVPNLNFERWGDMIIQYPYIRSNPYDPTPSEAGVVQYCLDCLEYLNWKPPVDCSTWDEYCKKWRKSRAWQWQSFGTNDSTHPNGNGRQQLLAMGINVAKGQFRPTISFQFGSLIIAKPEVL